MRRRSQRKRAIAATPAAAAEEQSFSRSAIRASLTKRFLLRLHMTFMITSTIGAGIAATNFLTLMHVDTLAVRYAAAVIAAYCVFLALVRLWLWYVGIQIARSNERSSFDIDGSGVDITDFNVSRYLSGLRPGAPSFSSGGGQFGGGGATGSWADAAAPVKSSSSDGGGFGGLDLGDDSGAIMLIIAIIVAVIVAAAAAFYLIYAAPAILSEVAFEGVLAAAVARRTREMSNIGWIGAVSKKTFWPFAAVLASAIAVGWVAQHICPDAKTIAQALHCAPL